MRNWFAFLLLAALPTPPAAAQNSPAVEFNNDIKSPEFSVTARAGASPGSPSGGADGRSFLAVFVKQASHEGTDVPPLTGAYRWENHRLVFAPRYPLQPGLAYRVVFRPRGEQTSPADVITREFAIPERETTPSAFVEQVYPTSNLLPENQLKFYVHFSAPMSRGEAYRRVHLLDGAGNPINLPFLEIEQELWDPEGRRLTLLFDPGRVKRDLLPNREVGSPLRDGERYTLVIDRAWPDAAGTPLKEDFRKSFQAGPPDHTSPDEKDWKVTSPKAGTRDALTVLFPEPMDYALASRVIHVTTATGERIAGRAGVGLGETRWTFQPEDPWQSGAYLIETPTILEDLAGNSLGRPFEVDVFEKVEDRVVHATRAIRFRVETAAGNP